MVRRGVGQPPILPGYTYVRPLGSGGFADVFLYEQDMPRRVVAVKVLIDDAINPEVLRTFNKEADILARLSAHPAIVTIYQASISADGRPYFVMEYCPDNMGSQYKRGPMPQATVLDAGVRVAAALETAHRSGVLHRDIKPSNILVTTLGSPALADFGIAAALAGTDEKGKTVAMSVPWSAPEVIVGQVSGSIATEIYSLGATLYTMLAARAPYELPSGERLPRAKLQERTLTTKYVPTGRTDIVPRLHDILARALSKDPSRRFASMIEFAQELQRAQADAGISPTAVDVVDPSWASAAVQADDDGGIRAPSMSTVRQDSRRAQRAQSLASAQRRAAIDKDEAPATESQRRATLKGALIGAGVVGAIALLAVIVVVRP
jgi:serine/threonine protein kinase